MQIKAIIRTPRDTPTVTPILIPSLDSGDATAVLLLLEEIESAIERAVVVEEVEGMMQVEDVSVDDVIAIDDTTVSVTFSVILSVVVIVVAFVSFSTVPSELMLK